MEKEDPHQPPNIIPIFWLFPLCLHLLWDIYLLQLFQTLLSSLGLPGEVKDRVSGHMLWPYALASSNTEAFFLLLKKKKKMFYQVKEAYFSASKHFLPPSFKCQF